MNCFVALSLPEYLLQALVFAGEGEAGERPWAVVSLEDGAEARVLAVSRTALRQGVAAGQNQVEARALAPELVTLPRSPEAENRLHGWLRKTLDDVSPRVQCLASPHLSAASAKAEGAAWANSGAALWLLDMAGLERLRGPVLEQARGLRRKLRQHRLEAGLGLASTGVAAVLAALGAGEYAPPVWFLTAGREAGELARLPLFLLARFPHAALVAPPDGGTGRRSKKKRLQTALQWEEALELLTRWGLKTLGDVAGLPAQGLVERLGPLGARLQSLARGEECPLMPPAVELREQLAFRLEWDPPEEDGERLLAAARTRLEELARELERRDRVVEKILLQTVSHPHPAQEALVVVKTGELEARRPAARPHWSTVRPLLVPVRDLRSLGAQVEAGLAARPFLLPVERLEVRLELAPPRRIQPRLFEQANLDPGKLDRLLERLRELLNDPAGRRIGTPRLLDAWKPEAFVLHSFALEARAVVEEPAAEPEEKGAFPLCSFRFRPPIPVRLRFPPAPLRKPDEGEAGSSSSLNGAECLLAGASPLRILASAGPWRRSGDWWNAAAWSRDEWDVELSNHGLYLLVHNRRSGAWFLEAEYT